MTRDATGAASPAPPPPQSRDWFFVEVFEWMWREDGMGLKPGADLMVYATIYRASAHGGGAFVATNASMGNVLGYPRETISRSVGRLLKAGLVWVVGHIHDGHGGKPVKCYAVCQARIDRVQSRMPARRLIGYLAPEGTSSTTGAGVPALVPARGTTTPDATGTDGAANQQADGNVTKRHIGPDAPPEGFLQSVTDRHETSGQRDDASRPQCDDASHVTKRHIAQNGAIPAKTPLFDMPLINTCYLLPNKVGEGSVESRHAATTATIPGDALGAKADGMRESDLLAFSTLVERSVRPVDPGYLAQNLREFRQLIEEGVTADVILEAYDGYAAYQSQMMAEHGESRPLHLLHWLRQRPNNNIQYVLNARDERWRAERLARKPTGSPKRPSPTHEEPRLERLIERGEHVWFVHDERGGRIVTGSRGVDTRTQALSLYETMYECERRP